MSNHGTREEHEAKPTVHLGFFETAIESCLEKTQEAREKSFALHNGEGAGRSKKKELAKREKEVRKGSQEWRNFLVASGIEHVDKFDTELLFLANGSKPPIPTLEENDDVGVPDSDDEDDNIIAIDTIDDV